MIPKPARFLQLFGIIFSIFLGILLCALLLMIVFRYAMVALDYIPWLTYIYMGIMLCIPPVLFNTVFYIFFKRTGVHPSKPVRLFSKSVFILAGIFWFVLWASDMLFFIKTGYGDLQKYQSYDLIPLTASVAFIFLMGVLQALTTEKEVDWMDKYKTAGEDVNSKE